MIKVLIVDDSAVVRKVLTDELSRYRDIKVVGSAVDPFVARDKIVRLKPDVITLDMEMPRMDGLSFLTKLMKYYPMPVVVVSSLTPQNSELAFRAIKKGAIEVICKPDSPHRTNNISRQIVHAIRAAASARIKKHREIQDKPLLNSARKKRIRYSGTDRIIAIGASTGGTEAIEAILRGLPAESPGAVIVQHMPEYFTAIFAERLDTIVDMEVREARDNDRVEPGLALIAKGNSHMVLQKAGAYYRVRIKGGPPIHHQRPSVDVLFQSVAAHAGNKAVGVLCTGMGTDGAKGLAVMRKNGAHTMVQDEESCVVFGMPREAIKLGGAGDIVSLAEISRVILNKVTRDIDKENAKSI